jgi:tyrosyl-tRNA synthetase
MTTLRSDLLHVLHARGFIHQGTDLAALDAAALKGAVVGYNGFDATADSLHVGHLLPIMMLRWMQKTGHKVIALLGGGTTKVGDPSGRDESRQLLTNEIINANIASIANSFARFLAFEGANPAVLVNNADWLDELKYVPFLRDIGRHFSVNRMLGFDSVKLRLEREQPLSFLEFNYMILQAYDFVELYRRYGCTLQTGGSDQWGNIVNGVELGRRVVQAELYGLTCPLLTTASGAKMGKTAAGAVWLNADRLAPYDYYQYWRNTEDADVGRFLRLFTELPLAEIAKLEALQGAEINEAKKVLALAATGLAHGEAAAAAAAETARRTFEEGAASEGLPTVEMPRAQLAGGIAVVELLRLAGLAPSNGEARRLIRGGGAKLNDVAIEDEKAVVDLSACDREGVLKLTAGKKRHALIKAV